VRRVPLAVGPRGDQREHGKDSAVHR
jgi:hypothetical protein